MEVWVASAIEVLLLLKDGPVGIGIGNTKLLIPK